MALCHATCVVVEGCGVLIRGPSGSGKSDLALRLIDEGAELVADDYCEISIADGHLWARCPATIKGKLEVRGIGIVTLPAREQCEIGLVIELKTRQLIERFPETATATLDGITVACFAIDPFDASAKAKVRAAVAQLRAKAGGA